jgi:hypothetical protein
MMAAFCITVLNECGFDSGEEVIIERRLKGEFYD